MSSSERVSIPIPGKSEDVLAGVLERIMSDSSPVDTVEHGPVARRPVAIVSHERIKIIHRTEKLL